MQEQRAGRVVAGLRAVGADAHLERNSVYEFGVAVQLPDGRRAVWDADGSDVLSATVMRDGVLVGYVPIVASSAGLSDQATVAVIARTDYDAPVGERRERGAPARSAPAGPEGFAGPRSGRFSLAIPSVPRRPVRPVSSRPTAESRDGPSRPQAGPTRR